MTQTQQNQQDKSDGRDGLEAFRRWLVPGLLTMIAILGGNIANTLLNKLQELDVKINKINEVITKQAVTDKDVDHLKEVSADNKEDIKQLRSDFNDHVYGSENSKVYRDAEKRLKQKL